MSGPGSSSLFLSPLGLPLTPSRLNSTGLDSLTLPQTYSTSSPLSKAKPAILDNLDGSSSLSWIQENRRTPPSRSRFKYWSNSNRSYSSQHQPHRNGESWSNPRIKICYPPLLPNDRVNNQANEKIHSEDHHPEQLSKWKRTRDGDSSLVLTSKNQGPTKIRKTRSTRPFNQKNCIESVPSSELFEVPVHMAIRSGVIPYSCHNNKIYWLMGITPGSKWSDFGGGCKTRIKETPANALIREVDEESSGVLTKIIQKTMIDNPEGIHVWRAHNRHNPPIYRYLSFIQIPYQDYNSKFKPNREVASLSWISQETILGQIHYPRSKNKRRSGQSHRKNLDCFHEPLIPYIRYFRYQMNLGPSQNNGETMETTTFSEDDAIVDLSSCYETSSVEVLSNTLSITI